MPPLSLVLYVLIRSPADSVGFARARLLPGPRANRLRHPGATIGAQDGVKLVKGARRWNETATNLPAASLRARFCLPAG